MPTGIISTAATRHLRPPPQRAASQPRLFREAARGDAGQSAAHRCGQGRRTHRLLVLHQGQPAVVRPPLGHAGIRAGLHFETCYQQGIEYAIAHGLKVFEGGAQGEHKLARGLVPTATHSWHWLENDEFRKAVDRFLERETDAIGHYMDELDGPFRREPPRLRSNQNRGQIGHVQGAVDEQVPHAQAAVQRRPAQPECRDQGDHHAQQHFLLRRPRCQ